MGSETASSPTYRAGLRVGLLGGGQLARMIAIAGHALGLEIHVLSRKKDDPAAQVVRHWHKGSPDEREDVRAFLTEVDVATFESEFHDGDLLADVSRETGTPLWPRPELMKQLQDRLPQKEALDAARVPTASFIAIHGVDDLQTALHHFENGFVLKRRTGGYDGFGTFVIKNEKDLDEFRARPGVGEERFIAEQFVHFKRELAVSLARNARGQVVFTPFVETHQTDHRLDWLRGPIRPRGGGALKTRLRDFAEALDYRGLVTFELFETSKGLIVNEIAPRVHNSGHYGIEGLDPDQFTLHLKAVLDLDLTTPLPRAPAFAMVNLVGTREKAPEFPGKFAGQLHWYGKTENRPGRKMGHLTAVGAQSARLLKHLQTERKRFKL